MQVCKRVRTHTYLHVVVSVYEHVHSYESVDVCKCCVSVWERTCVHQSVSACTHVCDQGRGGTAHWSREPALNSHTSPRRNPRQRAQPV